MDDAALSPRYPPDVPVEVYRPRMKLLVVEAALPRAEPLSVKLRALGHLVEVQDRCEAARRRPIERPFDAIVLDRALPDGDGLGLLVDWRSLGLRTPVLIVTARASLEERRAGLRAGADDYLGKPCDFEELVLRIESIHRRAMAWDGATDLGGGVLLDRERRVLSAAGSEIALTAREFGLLSELAREPGEVLSRQRLLDRVWGEKFDGLPNVVDVYIGYVRTKLARAGATAEIRTVRGAGYRLIQGD